MLPTPAPPLQQHTGYSVAHYLTSSHFWSALRAAGARGRARAGGGGPCWRWRSSARSYACCPRALGKKRSDYAGVSSKRSSGCSGCVALFSLAAYLITPETAAGPNGDPLGFAFNLRYLAPALALALAVAPLAPALRERVARSGRAWWPCSPSFCRDRRPTGAVAELRTPRARSRSGWPRSSRLGLLVAARGPVARGDRDRGDRAVVCPRRRGRRLPPPAPLPPRPLRVPAGRLLPGEGVGAVPDGPRFARGRRRHVRRLLLVSVLRTGSLEPSDLRRPARARTGRSRQSPPALDGGPR